jgi:hypothetical protein
MGTLLSARANSRLFFLPVVIFREIQRESAARVGANVAANANEALAALVKHVFETNDNALKVRLTTTANVVADLAEIHIVQGGIHLVHDKERSWAIRVDRKQ